LPGKGFLSDNRKGNDMTDNLQNRGPQDRERVNVHEEWERRYWSEKWNVTQQELERAVNKVGPMAEDVAKELGQAN
jgi:hypothetical protein